MTKRHPKIKQAFLISHSTAVTKADCTRGLQWGLLASTDEEWRRAAPCDRLGHRGAVRCTQRCRCNPCEVLRALAQCPALDMSDASAALAPTFGACSSRRRCAPHVPAVERASCRKRAKPRLGGPGAARQISHPPRALSDHSPRVPRASSRQEPAESRSHECKVARSSCLIECDRHPPASNDGSDSRRFWRFFFSALTQLTTVPC